MTIMIRVGVPHYINTYPLIYPLEKKLLFNDIEFVFDTPRAINKALQNGEIDVGLVSSHYFMKNLADLDIVTTLGIGATKKVMSVALFTKKPLKMLHGGKIGLINSSETSIALLEVLMREVWKIEFETCQIDESIPHDELEQLDGFLMIGDRALQMHDLSEYQRIDLSTEWHQATELPFVFALFATKKGSQFKWLHFALRFAYEWSLKNRDTIVDAAFEKTNIPKARLQRYFSTLDYQLSKEHMEGLHHFHTLWKSHADLLTAQS